MTSPARASSPSDRARKVFWEDPYLAELETTVASVVSDEVTLDSTVFYALSGGQESDHGTIGGRTVLEARKEGHRIVYKLDPDHQLTPGTPVSVSIDWDRRYRLMRLHFAAEIVLELIAARFSGIEKIGAHIAADKARIDFKWSESLSGHLAEVTDQAMAIVTSDVAITSAFADEENGRRYWEIPGFARVPCGGTHLRRTGEIGKIGLKRDNVGKGKERIVIRVDERPSPPPSPKRMRYNG